MASVKDILAAMRNSPNNVRFSDCLRVCTHYFGSPKVRGSHHVFKTPWQGDPWVNIQDKGGYAKSYQVKQVLSAIDRLEDESDA